jgi:hypothetical protein
MKENQPPYPPKLGKNYKKSMIKSPSGGFWGLRMKKSKVSNYNKGKKSNPAF